MFSFNAFVLSMFMLSVFWFTVLADFNCPKATSPSPVCRNGKIAGGAVENAADAVKNPKAKQPGQKKYICDGTGRRGETCCGTPVGKGGSGTLCIKGQA